MTTTIRTLRLPMAVSWSDNYTQDTSSKYGCQLEWQLHSGHFVYRWLSVGVTTTFRTLRIPMVVSWSHNYTQDTSSTDGCQLEWQLHSRYFVYRWLSVDQCVATERQQMYKGDTNVQLLRDNKSTRARSMCSYWETISVHGRDQCVATERQQVYKGEVNV